MTTLVRTFCDNLEKPPEYFDFVYQLKIFLDLEICIFLGLVISELATLLNYLLMKHTGIYNNLKVFK